MVEPYSRPGVLLPADTLALLGSGPQGAAALFEYRIATTDFEAELAALLERLEGSDDIEAPAQLMISRTMASVARGARAWISIRSDSDDFSPAIMLVSDDAVLTAVLHGAAVEYVIDEPACVARIVGTAVEMHRDSEIHVTLFDGDTAIAGVRFAEGLVDLAAKDADRLERLSAAARGGLGELTDVLLSESSR